MGRTPAEVNQRQSLLQPEQKQYFRAFQLAIGESAAVTEYPTLTGRPPTVKHLGLRDMRQRLEKYKKDRCHYYQDLLRTQS